MYKNKLIITRKKAVYKKRYKYKEGGKNKNK